MSSKDALYSTAFDRALRRGRAVKAQMLDERSLKAAAAAVMRHTGRARRLYLANSAKAARPEVALFLLRECEAAARDQRSGAEQLAVAALMVVGTLRAPAASATLIADLRARGLAQLANQRRISYDYKRATEYFRRARQAMAVGTGDVLLRAWLLDLEGSLRRDQGQISGASRATARAAALYRAGGDEANVAKALLNHAITRLYANEPRRALGAAARVAALLRANPGSGLEFALFHNLLAFLEADGQPHAALYLWPSVEPLYKDQPELVQLRGRWLYGRLEASQGHHREAVTALDAVRRGFLAQGLAYDAALASLDLALSHAHLHEHLEMFRLAREMYDVFYAKDIPREASAALILFIEAARASRADVALIERVKSELLPVRRASGR